MNSYLDRKASYISFSFSVCKHTSQHYSQNYYLLTEKGIHGSSFLVIWCFRTRIAHSGGMTFADFSPFFSRPEDVRRTGVTIVHPAALVKDRSEWSERGPWSTRFVMSPFSLGELITSVVLAIRSLLIVSRGFPHNRPSSCQLLQRCQKDVPLIDLAYKWSSRTKEYDRMLRNTLASVPATTMVGLLGKVSPLVLTTACCISSLVTRQCIFYSICHPWPGEFDRCQ
ncbi:hypothetical protein JOM56_014548 [Amanita muscaria]